MFWRKKKRPEDERREKAKRAVQKIEGPLWGYMVTRRGAALDVLQRLRRVEREGTVWGEPATLVRIFDPATAEKAGVMVESYESLNGHRGLILYEGYYRGAEMADIHIVRARHNEEEAPNWKKQTTDQRGT